MLPFHIETVFNFKLIKVLDEERSNFLPKSPQANVQQIFIRMVTTIKAFYDHLWKVSHDYPGRMWAFLANFFVGIFHEKSIDK